MSCYFVVVQKVTDRLCGRNLDKKYAHVMCSARRDSRSFQDLVKLSPWNDSLFKEYLVEITQTEFEAIKDGSDPLTWGTPNQPKWQWNGSECGSWVNPTDDTSVWQPGVPIQDDRWIIRIYDRAPGDPQANHVGSEKMDESATLVTRWIKLFNPDDTPNITNEQDRKVDIGGQRMIFDFTNGETSLEISPERPGTVLLLTNHQYRVIGPSGEMSYTANIYGRVLRPPVE